MYERVSRLLRRIIAAQMALSRMQKCAKTARRRHDARKNGRGEAPSPRPFTFLRASGIARLQRTCLPRTVCVRAAPGWAGLVCHPDRSEDRPVRHPDRSEERAKWRDLARTCTSDPRGKSLDVVRRAYPEFAEWVHSARDDEGTGGRSLAGYAGRVSSRLPQASTRR